MVVVVSFALSQVLTHFKEGGIFPFTSIVSLFVREPVPSNPLPQEMIPWVKASPGLLSKGKEL